MEPFDPARVPAPFGLANVGASCHFNALMQALSSCPAVVKAAADNRDFLGRTATGRAFYSFMRAVGESGGNPAFVVDPSHAARVLQALVQELRARRPAVRFGNSMESATEGLVLLLEMMEPPSGAAGQPFAPASPSATEAELSAAPAQASQVQFVHPLMNLFRFDVRERVLCRRCLEVDPPSKGITSLRRDTRYQFHYFHYDHGAITTPEAFAKHLREHLVALDDYKCDKCCATGPARRCPRCPEGARGPKCADCRRLPSSKMYRMCDIRSVPTVIVVMFNQYGPHVTHYFPESFDLPGAPAAEGGPEVPLRFRQVAQVEHAGGLSGGHYWARGVRRRPDGELSTYRLNDASTDAAPFGPNPSVYSVFYHYWPDA